MKHSTFRKLLTQQVLSGVLVTCIALILGDVATAADISDTNNQSRSNLFNQEAVVAQNTSNASKLWERNLQTDDFDGARLLRIQLPATACYTFAGPVCPLTITLPQGALCSCYYLNGWLNGRAW
jgi:hypothetical protein